MSISDVFVAIIDGTGDSDTPKYTQEMNASFCQQMARALGVVIDSKSGEGRSDRCFYTRGPGWSGERVPDLAKRAVSALRSAQARSPHVKLMLAGYSRGGACAVLAAKELDELNIDVEEMFLFDPVARHLHLRHDTDLVPSNVRRVWVARRDFLDPSWDKYDGFLVDDPAGHNPIRKWFGTKALRGGNPKGWNPKKVHGTHGALGGVGWSFVPEDFSAQDEVAAFFNQAFREAGLDSIRLHNIGTCAKPKWSIPMRLLRKVVQQAIVPGFYETLYDGVQRLRVETMQTQRQGKGSERPSQFESTPRTFSD